MIGKDWTGRQATTRMRCTGDAEFLGVGAC